MPQKPSIGSPGGQQYPVLRSIQKFLQQMAEGGARAAPTVIKEILQNADDAGASELVVVLDERQAPAQMPSGYADLFGPALLVRNNARFHLCEVCRRDGKEDCDHEKRDDFYAIKDVAASHKRAQATAAGRFGIGFNSVYFLTDTPLLFSRREVHVFDLLGRVFEDNGWGFSLEDFPANAPTDVGPIKSVLEWCLPKSALAERSFGDLALDPVGDYQQTVFRLPLRRTPSGTRAIYDDRFPDAQDRFRVLREMVEESARSILFLKHITSISFSVLREREPDAFARVEATPPPAEFAQFLQQVREFDRQHGPGRQCDCRFDRTIKRWIEGADAPNETSWNFHVKHTARFDDSELIGLRERLRQNEERAVPWAALAVPLDLEACRLDGGGPASWRVFLPLLEEGPSSCVFNASLFIGPSRQRIEFRLNESDEGRRRTDWNQALVKNALIPLLQDLSTELPDLARRLLEDHPREYLSLFPRAEDDAETQPTGGLTAFVRQRFSRGVWLLRLPDVWGNQFDVLVGDESSTLALEMIPEWLIEYRDRFRELSTPQRRFVRYTLGDALAARVGRMASMSISRQPSADVALAVLRHRDPPKPPDLSRLLKLVEKSEALAEVLEGSWAFIAGDGGRLLRYSTQTLYVLDDKQREHQALAVLRELRLTFESVEWVRPDVGLAALASDLRPPLENIIQPTASAALDLLRRLPTQNAHDQFAQSLAIRPIVDFLIGEAWTRIPSDARLGFLIRTAAQKEPRRERGVILLRPATPTPSDDALWEVWFRRLFAEVDPGFAREVNRLLSVHPLVLGLLHARDCPVAVGSMEEALAILHSVRLRAPAVYDLLEGEMNTGAGRHGDAPQRIASGLLEIADTRWDRLDDEERYTMQALPIHRRPDGRFVSLLPARDGDPSSVQTAFRLQSNEDIQDAPVTLPACQLLQTANPAVRDYYRRRLGLGEHGRIAVLKDILRQIGGANEPANERMLRYLATHYEDTLRQREATGNVADMAEAQELRRLFAAARTVPCVDGAWRPAGECTGAWRVAERLTAQGWPQERLTWLLTQLFHREYVAQPKEWVHRLIQRLHQLREHDTGTIVERAVTSEGTELSLKDRVKLLRDNWRDRPDTVVSRSTAAGELQVPVLGGRAALATVECVEAPPNFPAAMLRALAPEAVDVRSLARELGLDPERVLEVLDAFCIPRRTAQDLDARLIERFAEVWPSLRQEDRLDVLRQIGERGLASRLREQAGGLDNVLVPTRPPGWQRSARVLQPEWAETQPPHVAPECQPTLTGIARSIRQVWQEWCGVRSFGDVFTLVLDGAAQASTDPADAAKAIYDWLDRAVSSALTDEIVGHLQTRRWVLARRGNITEFHRPGDVLLHPGERVLRAQFWVPAVPLPECARRAHEALGFAMAPPATPETLRGLGECLAERTAASDHGGALHVYDLVEELLDQSEPLGDEWQQIAARQPVYRVFRHEETQVSSQELFIGDGDYKDDLSPKLLCLKAGPSLPKGVLSVYRHLGVNDRPSVAQVLAALAQVETADRNERAAHGRLVRTLEELAGQPGAPIALETLSAVRVLTCAGTYEPISRCYWDEEFGRRRSVSTMHGSRLVDTTDRNTQRLAEWIRARGPGVLVALRATARLEIAEEPPAVDLTPELSYLLLPWRQWAQDIVREGSALADQLAKLDLVPPHEALKIVPVSRIQVRFHLDDGAVIEQANGWDGPLALGDASGRVFVRLPTPRASSRTDAAALGPVDAAIAREVAILLGGAPAIANLKACVDEILATLERPSTVLRRLRATYRKHFLHQYHDQVADPHFAELFDEYQRTVQSSKRAIELEERMHSLLAEGFVRARREQIRGYGYDEFSVFAELLQNAEDAYIQRSRLGMEITSPCGIAYRYSEVGEGERVLEVEHRGRPFNYWQHGLHQDRSLSRDVEGVLRSAGSFKPYFGSPDIATPEAMTIGRFGLGFKSVYLLTDRPEIHSGSWHFAIEAGCLPEEVLSPGDLDEEMTRIRLPLRADIEVLRDASQLLDLMPFLGMVRRLEFRTDGAAPIEFSVCVEDAVAVGSMLVEQVVVSGPDVLCDDGRRFIRCRSRDHAGQLALLLARDGTPARWDETFDYDLFAVLPLRADLGCGVAASHRFEVQSGRTHLVDPKANAMRFAEVAALLEGLTEGLRACASTHMSLTDVLTRFWALWRWEQGDTECESLRKELAKTLVGLAERSSVVPTLDTERPTSLADGPRFFFSELPDAFREAMVAVGVAIPVTGFPASSALSQANVVAEGFASAYRRACEYAGVRRARTLVGIGWDEVAKAFCERAWFAERPKLLSSLAESLNEEQAGKVAAWVALCPVLGEDGAGQAVHVVPCELLPPEFPGCGHLPKRYLRRVSAVYGDTAIELLTRAGLRTRPSSDDLRDWVHADDLTAADSIGILRYLAEGEQARFHTHSDLKSLFRSEWFPGTAGRLSTAKAVERGLIPEGVLRDDVFRAWLGVGESPEPPPPPPRPRRSPSHVLEDLFAWWQTHGALWAAKYEERLYPTGRPPSLRDSFSPRDRGERRQWITLLLLGAFHTMGWTRFEQHRAFLLRCERKGWLDVFADPKSDAERWIRVLKEYLDPQIEISRYYRWMEQFVRIFQLSRWLPEYVEAFLGINNMHEPFALDAVTAPRASALLQGTDIDAPPITRTLGMGACFMVRELTRMGVLKEPQAHPHCFIPVQRVRRFLAALGCDGLDDERGHGLLRRADQSRIIYQFLVEQMGTERATFNGGFDLPLLAVAEDPDLQEALLGEPLGPDDPEGIDSAPTIMQS